MDNLLIYKDYVGSIEFSEIDNIFFGKVQNTNSLISYEGTNIRELTDDFHYAVDEYIASCKEIQ